MVKGLSITNAAQARYSTTTSSSRNHLVLQWFRGTDLRLHDNPSLCQAVELNNNNKIKSETTTTTNMVCLYCFDPRIFGNHHHDDAVAAAQQSSSRTSTTSLKCGPKRAKFIIESVTDLRRKLEEQGSGLLVAHGKPEDIMSRWVQQYTSFNQSNNNYNNNHTTGIAQSIIPHVVCQQEVCSEELAVDKAVHNAMTLIHPKATLTKVWGSTLYNKDALPFNDGPYGIPDTYTPFRTKVEKACKIDKPLPVPRKVDLTLSPVLADFGMMDKCSFQYMPTLQDLGYSLEDMEHADGKGDPRGVMPFLGGETAALARVQEYIWDKDLLKIYFDTRNGMIGADYSTKFAPWLATGCLSPRYVAQECLKYEQERVANKSTYWVVFELLWRDYFKFFALKHGNKIFFPGGTIDSDQQWSYDARYVQAWKEGKTGYPLVDANMRELAATGFMSNRGRQNVASFLALDMKCDWRHGADYFEEVLLDYDVHSNWGNWCAAAGMTGGRINRFNIVKQSKDYDQHGDYVRQWLPELNSVPTKFVHEPWMMSASEQKEFMCQLGVDYPNPIVPPLGPQPYGKSKGDRNAGGPKRDGAPNKNRGKGQREDMKSLRTGQFRMN